MHKRVELGLESASTDRTFGEVAAPSKRGPSAYQIQLSSAPPPEGGVYLASFSLGPVGDTKGQVDGNFYQLMLTI